MKPVSKKSLLAPFLALFTSMGTLICCALPALMVSIGAGAALAGLLSAFPQLALLSEHKEITFGVSGGLLLLALWLFWYNRNAPCPIGRKQARACKILRSISKWILILTVLIYAVGVFFAFFATKIL